MGSIIVSSCLIFLSLARLGVCVESPSKIPEVPRACISVDAEAYLDRHKWTEARDCYLEIVKRDPRSETDWAGLATALTYLGHRQEALKKLSQAIDHVKSSQREHLLARIKVLSRLFLTNTTFQIYQDGLILLSSRKFKSAQEKFEKALNEEADNVEVLLRLGQITLLEDSPKEALAHFKIAKQLDPYDPGIRLWLGKALHRLGNTHDALSELKEGYYLFNLTHRDLNRELKKLNPTKPSDSLAELTAEEIKTDILNLLKRIDQLSSLRKN